MNNEKNGSKTILVLGDMMIDTHVETTVCRIAPEGPLPVCKETSRTHSLGGAGLVVANLASLGYNVIPVSVIGADAMGKQVTSLLENLDIITEGIFIALDRPTTHKTRLFSEYSLLSRLDEEESQLIEKRTEQEIIDFIVQKISSCCAVVLADYRKGVVTENILTSLRVKTIGEKIPVFADPKYLIERFEGIHTLKINYPEFSTALSCDCQSKGIESQLKTICSQHNFGRIFVTLAENGIVGYDADKDTFVKVNGCKTNVINVTGAGDVVLSLITALTLDDVPLHEICKISDFIGRLSVQTVGNFLVSNNDIYNYLRTDKVVNDLDKLKFIVSIIRRSGKTIVFTNGCFDVFHHAHLSNLERSKSLADVLMVGINTDESIRTLKGKDRPINPIDFRIKILNWIPEVDFIIPFNSDTPEHILDCVRPNILTKGSDYTKESIIGSQYADRVEIVENISTCSSTQIINTFNLKPFTKTIDQTNLEPKPQDCKHVPRTGVVKMNL